MGCLLRTRTKTALSRTLSPTAIFVYFRYIAFSEVGITIEELPRVPFLAAFNCMTGSALLGRPAAWFAHRTVLGHPTLSCRKEKLRAKADRADESTASFEEFPHTGCLPIVLPVKKLLVDLRSRFVQRSGGRTRH
jgi:hypothetical protein